MKKCVEFVQNPRKWCTEFASYARRIFSFFGAEFWQPYYYYCYFTFRSIDPRGRGRFKNTRFIWQCSAECLIIMYNKSLIQSTNAILGNQESMSYLYLIQSRSTRKMSSLSPAEAGCEISSSLSGSAPSRVTYTQSPTLTCRRRGADSGVVSVR